jgi:hypothetical protein
MGSSGSTARHVVSAAVSSETKPDAIEKAKVAKTNVDQMMTVLGNKLEAMERASKAARGTVSKAEEVTGGRTIMRVSDIRLATASNPDAQMMAGINDFFAAAEQRVDGADNKAKNSAIKGAQKLLSSGINVLMGVEKGQSMQQNKFVILFLNNAFVRVDYKIYSYSISGKRGVWCPDRPETKLSVCSQGVGQGRPYGRPLLCGRDVGTRHGHDVPERDRLFDVAGPGSRRRRLRKSHANEDEARRGRDAVSYAEARLPHL